MARDFNSNAHIRFQYAMEGAISSLKEWLSDSAIGSNPVLRLIAGIIFMHEQDYTEALKHTHSGGTLDLVGENAPLHLNMLSVFKIISAMHRSDFAEKQVKIMQQIDENHTLTQLANAWLDIAVVSTLIQLDMHRSDFAEKQVKIMQQIDENHTLTQLANAWLDIAVVSTLIQLDMHRSDFAEKQVKIMQQIDEDHTLTQLANAWLDIAVAGSKIREAYLMFQDFAEKYPMTAMVRNCKAVCCMHMGSFDESETLLLEALNKDAKDPETLANLIVCNLHLGKPSSRYLRGTNLNKSDIEDLCKILVKMPSLGELDIGDNSIMDEGIRFLICFISPTLRKAKSLSRLRAENCDLTNIGVTELLECLPSVSEPLNLLSIADNHLGSVVLHQNYTWLQIGQCPTLLPFRRRAQDEKSTFTKRMAKSDSQEIRLFCKKKIQANELNELMPVLGEVLEDVQIGTGIELFRDIYLENLQYVSLVVPGLFYGHTDVVFCICTIFGGIRMCGIIHHLGENLGKAERHDPTKFALVWNRIINSFRSEDLINNIEMDLMTMPMSLEHKSGSIRWPMLLLAKKFSEAVDMVANFTRKSVQLFRKIKKDNYMLCAINDFYELTKGILEFLVISEIYSNTESEKSIQNASLLDDFRMDHLSSLVDKFD
uniref:Callose synthase helical domain-containing protein n=1 Tax=Oryza brachyantha TaxID=4533 RepID=J3M5Q4_ORYBR